MKKWIGGFVCAAILGFAASFLAHGAHAAQSPKAPTAAAVAAQPTNPGQVGEELACTADGQCGRANNCCECSKSDSTCSHSTPVRCCACDLTHVSDPSLCCSGTSVFCNTYYLCGATTCGY